jgi:tetratricopeptide (TPR) repeat protein
MLWRQPQKASIRRLIMMAVGAVLFAVEPTRAQPNDHPAKRQALQTAILLNMLATRLQKEGAWAVAERKFKEALSKFEEALGPEDANVGTVLNNLGLLYKEQGRYAEAEPLYKRSLEILEKALGPDHPEVGTAVSNLAMLYVALGRMTEAAPLHERSRAITAKTMNRGRTSAAGPQQKCTEHSLGPGNDHVELSGWSFIILMDQATRPVVINCRPRARSVRAVDGTPGDVSCAKLRKSIIPAGQSTPLVFVGDANFIYEIALTDTRDIMPFRVCQ